MSDDIVYGKPIARLQLGPRAIIVSRGKRVELYVELGAPGDKAIRFVAGLEPADVDEMIDVLREAQAYTGRPPGRPAPADEGRAPGSPPSSWVRAAASGLAGDGAARPVQRAEDDGGHRG